MNASKRKSMIESFSAKAREYNRTGNVTLRAQAEESIRLLASRAAAKKIIANLYR